MCNFVCFKQSNFNKHLSTRKHKILTNSNGILTNPNSTTGKKCHTCLCGKSYSHASSLSQHKRTCANKMLTNVNKIVTDDGKITEYHEKKHVCVCGKSYAHAPSLSLHKKSCEVVQKEKEDAIHAHPSSNVNVMTESTQHALLGAIQDLAVNVKELKSNTYIQNNNNNFNMNFFLNETCKDAMNITDFVNSLELTLADLEKVGELGYAEGISRAFVNGLKNLEVTKRPIHCSDAKREILHIKDQDKWERDTENQDKIKRAIRDLSTKNIMLLDDWRKENPGCDNYDHRKNDLYLRMMVESMGPTDESAEKRDFSKIVRAVARNTIVRKDKKDTREPEVAPV